MEMNAPDRPLLADEEDNQEHTTAPTTVNSDDDVILYQLLVNPGSADKETQTSFRNRCCCNPLKDRWLFGTFTFGFLTWAGFIMTLFATFSCELVKINWTGSLKLSVTGLGVWRFQQMERKTDQNGQRYKEYKCMQQDSFMHQEIDSSETFFPVNDFIRMSSIWAPVLAGIVLVGVLVYMVVASVHPEKYMNRLTNPVYPWKTLTLCYVLAGIILLGAGTLELLAIFDLMNLIDPSAEKDTSPICNPSFSGCGLGFGGIVAVTGVACCYAGGLLAFVAAYVTAGTRRRQR